MTLTPYQIATRHMATEVEHINRLLHTRDLSDRQDKALEMQAHIIVDQSEEIANLRRRVIELDEVINGPRI